MTHNYNIEVLQTKTHFKATYRDGKFRKLEHLRGKVDRPFMLAIGRILPLYTDDIPEFNKTHEGKVNYTIITQEKSLHTQFMSEWTLFYENYANIPPKITGADGKALKGIVGYLTKVSKTEAEALDSWRMILDRWSGLSKFHQENTDLKYINSKLNLIINAIKRSTNNSQDNFTKSMESQAAKSFRFK